ncbi:MAG: hypothetical protein NZ581_06170 [Candidatus Caldarchaeum sp.]|nr:hypothetical protein [Candidatus Caldarchaeum sp.]MDW8435767.1 hypothetical protein [Candidatus Caldarchaeum sp.]
MKRKKGLSEVVGLSIVTAVVVMLGIGLWYYLMSQTAMARTSEVFEVGGQALLLRSYIGADYVFYPDTIYGRGYGKAMIRNLGQEPIVVFRLISISNGTIAADTGVRELARIPVGGQRQFIFECPALICSDDKPITLQVHYTPERLFRPDDPRFKEHYSETLLYKIASFTATPAIVGTGSACSIRTPHWLIVELVDPKEDTIYGHSTDFVKIRVLNASVVRSAYSVGVRVVDGNGVTASGTATVSGGLPQEVYVRVDRGGLTPPFIFTLFSPDPEFTILPVDWSFPNSFGNFIDYTKLRVDLTRFTLDELILSMGFFEDGYYELVVDIYDCNGRLVTTGSLRMNITVGSLAGYFEQYSIVLRPPVRLFDIGRIVIRSVDHTPWVTVTRTVTETVTVWSTTTRTFFTTSTTTIRPTTTSTTITTITRPSTTTTRTATSTITTTVFASTTTSFITMTTTLVTATFTTTRTTTSTITSTTRSPTITSTSTIVVTSFTTTRTSTFTSTQWVTSTTTTTTTTTTTVTGGTGTNVQQLFVSDRGLFNFNLWIYYLVAASLLPIPLRRLLRGWNVR